VSPDFFVVFIFGRFCDDRFNGYLANISASQFASEFEERLPVSLSGREFLAQFGSHVDPATRVIPDHIYRVRSNARFAFVFVFLSFLLFFVSKDMVCWNTPVSHCFILCCICRI
jgi:hypothetical protein